MKRLFSSAAVCLAATIGMNAAAAAMGQEFLDTIAVEVMEHAMEAETRPAPHQHLNVHSFESGVPVVLPDSIEVIEVEEAESIYQEPAEQQAYSDIWKWSKRFMVGYTAGSIDRKELGGKISSRWGLSLIIGRNIYLHKKPIGGFLRIGLDLNGNIDYMNMAKGSGKLSDLWSDPDYDDDDYEFTAPSLGQHYLMAGLAVGPTLTFAPFFNSASYNLRTLRVRPYFHVIPSFATYMVSDEDDIELHNAFAFWCGGGFELQWKRLLVGFDWKSSTANYKGVVDGILSDYDEDHEPSGKHKFRTNMFTFSLGVAF